jgi:hypothetical protein
VSVLFDELEKRPPPWLSSLLPLHARTCRAAAGAAKLLARPARDFGAHSLRAVVILQREEANHRHRARAASARAGLAVLRPPPDKLVTVLRIGRIIAIVCSFREAALGMGRAIVQSARYTVSFGVLGPAGIASRRRRIRRLIMSRSRSCRCRCSFDRWACCRGRSLLKLVLRCGLVGN